jgi:hypothetical protein
MSDYYTDPPTYKSDHDIEVAPMRPYEEKFDRTSNSGVNRMAREIGYGAKSQEDKYDRQDEPLMLSGNASLATYNQFGNLSVNVFSRGRLNLAS